MTKYDVVIAGAGNNGLSTAAYLAKGGLKVCVLEAQDKVGGGCISFTDEFGATHDCAATVHSLISLNPMLVNDELGLKSKYGVSYSYQVAATTNLFVDQGTSLTLYFDLDRCCEEIASKLGQKEADSYREFATFCGMVGPMLTLGMFAPPVEADAMVSALSTLGPLGERLMRYLGMSAWEIACECFETQELRETATRFVSESMISPFEPQTGSMFVAVMYLIHNISYLPHCTGGSQKLADAMAECAKDNGADIRTGAKIVDVKLVDGRATAFVLENGEEIEGERLISTLHIKQLFGSDGMLGADVMGDEFTAKVDALKPSGYVGFLQNITLKEAPHFKIIDGVANGSIMEQSHGPEHFKALFDEMAKGNPSPYDSAATCTATVVDPSRGGEDGLHTLYLYNFEPYALYGDPANWDKYGQEIADKNLAAFCELCDNMTPDNILNRVVHNPLDYARRNPAWLCGDFCHISQEASQGSSNRPFPGMTRYVTPVPGLYLGGASAWPGPTLTGGGRAVAQVLFQEMGIDFDAVING